MSADKLIQKLMIPAALFIIGLTTTSCARHYVMEVPKEPESEMSMQPYAGAVWVNGEWEWRTNHHEYVKGHYNPPHRNSAYVPGEWKHSSKGYYYKHGHWKKSR